MPLTFKDAVRKMSNDPNLKLYYFFCEKGSDGKPVMLVDTKQMNPKKDGPAKDALDSAKSKANSSGTMRLREKVLTLKPQGASLPENKLSTGVKLAANHAQVQTLIQDVDVGEPEAEEGEKKEFADPLRSDPTIAKLLDERDEIRGKMAAVIGDDDPSDVIKDQGKRKTLQSLQTELTSVEEKLDEAQRELNEKGFKMQGLRSDYQEEDKKYGWRTGKPKERDQFASDQEYEEYLQKVEQLRESDRRLTKYFTEQERKDSQVNFDEQGRAIGKMQDNPDGTVTGPDMPMVGSKAEYVMDKSGKMHQFKQKGVKTGEKIVNPVTGTTVDKDVYTHHSSVLAGEDVVAAGEMEMDYQGYLKKISNKSGHYKPGATHVIQLLEELARQGALLDKTYMMPVPDENDKSPDGTPKIKGKPLDGKPKEIFEAIAKVEAGLKKKLEEGKDIQPDLDAIRKAKEALTKLGVAPANKFRNVEVEFIEGTETKEGLDIRQSTGTSHRAKKFMKTGGGNWQQGDKKKDMMKELREKLAKKAKDLDEEADKLALRVSGEMREKVAQLPEMLTWYQTELEEALQDNSDKGKALQKSLMAGITRIEAALRAPDTSDEGLSKVLEALNAQLAQDKQQVGEVSFDGPFEPSAELAQKLGVTVVKLKEWQDDAELTTETLAYKLSIDEDEVKEKLRAKQQPSQGGASLDGPFEPSAELARKLGVTVSKLKEWQDDAELTTETLAYKLSIDEDDVREKLREKKPVNVNVNVSNDDDDSDDDDSDLEDNAPQQEPTLDEWLAQGLRITADEVAQKLGIDRVKIDSENLMDGPNLVYPMDLVNKFKLKGEDVYEKLTGKKPTTV